VRQLKPAIRQLLGARKYGVWYRIVSYRMACDTRNDDDAVIVERIRGTDAPFYRPPLPEQESKSVHPGILTLMKQCWVEEPSERPSFSDVAKCLKTINKGKSVYLVLCYFTYSLKRFRPHRSTT